jgi:hypothetical protein
MKERVYQGIIAMLSISLVFAFVHLYKKDDITTSTEPMAFKPYESVEFKTHKPQYSQELMKKAHVKQKEKMDVLNMKVNTKLAQLNESMNETLQMVQEYNKNNPNTTIKLEPTQVIETNTYENDIPVDMEQVKEKYNELVKHYESGSIALATSSSSGSGTVSSGSANKEDEVEENIQPVVIKPNEPVIPEDPRHRKIADINDMIDQINQNLN